MRFKVSPIPIVQRSKCIACPRNIDASILHRLADISIVTPFLVSGWIGDLSARKRCGFIYSDYTSGIQRLYDGFADLSFTQVVRPNTRVEYEKLWFRRELANVLCYQRSPIVRPGWCNPASGHVVFGVYVFM
jgi:hypothetical protein